MKPPIAPETFQKLDLRVGTLLSVRTLPAPTAVAVLTVRVESIIEVLAAPSASVALDAGDKVVVAVNLHSLTVGELHFTATLVGGPVEPQLPDGARLQ